VTATAAFRSDPAVASECPSQPLHRSLAPAGWVGGTRLKMVKRQMYGGGKLDLLQARLLGAD
jgi:hypothetical protein